MPGYDGSTPDREARWRPNRIPNAVYKRMSTVFAGPFCAMMNETRRSGKIPKHFLEGDISMLYEKGDREDPRNYRPIICDFVLVISRTSFCVIPSCIDLVGEYAVCSHIEGPLTPQ